jgi:hypothetical protein
MKRIEEYFLGGCDLILLNPVNSQALVVRGWKRVSDNHFYRFEGSLITPNCHVISVIHMPVLRSFRQVCLDDLESIVLLTGSLFYLHFNNVVAMDSSLSTQVRLSLGFSGKLVAICDEAPPKNFVLYQWYLDLGEKLRHNSHIQVMEISCI